MKKYLLLLLVVLLVISGCSKEVKTEDNKTLFTCTKKGVKESSKVTDDTYTKDIKYQAKLDDDGKLLHYTTDFIYYYESVDRCNYYCDLKTEWTNDINKKNYSGFKRIVNCNCSKEKKVQETSEYDINNLDSFLRDDIQKMNSDNTFRLDEWLEKYEKADYNC